MQLLSGTLKFSASDLSGYLNCQHLTQLERKVALKEIQRPTYHDLSVEVLKERGRKHEKDYLDYLRSKGYSIVTLSRKDPNETIAAMKRGVDVIYQACLDRDNWYGFADFLVKVNGKSLFGDYQYEVYDTKLAHETKASSVLQLCFYSDTLSTMQQAEPEYLHVVKPGPDFPVETYRFAEFRAYYNLVSNQFNETMRLSPVETYPDPSVHCAICNWWQVCDKRREADDHLSLVAGIRAGQIEELRRQQIGTLQSFAETVKIAKPVNGNFESLLSKHEQAKIQYKGRVENALLHEFRTMEKGRGLFRLPEPGRGDIYFDIEGDAFYPDGGLEYILGYVVIDERGESIYHNHWARNRREERDAFKAFMGVVQDRLKRYPNLYIYHFAPYEPSALKRLARVHACYESEVDWLLRGERFIDLHAVFKEALLASVKVYSLKELEKFTGFVRSVMLFDAARARKRVEVALEVGDPERLDQQTIELVNDYNEDDCLATLWLHRWLENLRAEQITSGEEIPRPPVETGEANDDVEKINVRSRALYEELIAGLPDDRSAWTDEHHARWLLAHMIEYFRREDKSSWWEYFRVHEMEHDDLLAERSAITGLRFEREMPKRKSERNVTHRYRYPEQEVSVDEDDELHEVQGTRVGTVREISPEDNTIDIKKNKGYANVHPYAVHVNRRVPPGALVTSLQDIATEVCDLGLSRTWPYVVAKDLLMKRLPRLVDGSIGVYPLPGEEPIAAAVRIAFNLDKSYLAIQGPPGSGKTYTGAHIILALAREGKKVGITAVSHKVIRNLAMAAIRESLKSGESIEFVHKVKDISDPPPSHGIVETTESFEVISALAEGKVGCGTAWLWAEDNSQGKLDYLVIDEAGQMSLSQTLAASRAAKNLILLGDPQQLEQPQRGAHPEGSDVAALTYILGDQKTMPEGRGLFLAVTRRLHPAICAFTSEIFYEDKLRSLPGLENQNISGGTRFDGSGLYYVPVAHKGNQSKSPEEVDVIAGIVDELLARGCWTNDKNETQTLQNKDILIVAPYNAQVTALRQRFQDLEIGTVDKFQGQEAPVVIYSMVSSTSQDAPRGMSFLYSPNRLNVATSRARCVCILVASRELMRPDCNSVEQMRWANAMCRYVERAVTIDDDQVHTDKERIRSR